MKLTSGQLLRLLLVVFGLSFIMHTVFMDDMTASLAAKSEALAKSYGNKRVVSFANLIFSLNIAVCMGIVTAVVHLGDAAAKHAAACVMFEMSAMLLAFNVWFSNEALTGVPMWTDLVLPLIFVVPTALFFFNRGDEPATAADEHGETPPNALLVRTMQALALFAMVDWPGMALAFDTVAPTKGPRVVAIWSGAFEQLTIKRIAFSYFWLAYLEFRVVRVASRSTVSAVAFAVLAHLSTIFALQPSNVAPAAGFHALSNNKPLLGVLVASVTALLVGLYQNGGDDDRDFVADFMAFVSKLFAQVGAGAGGAAAKAGRGGARSPRATRASPRKAAARSKSPARR